MTEEEIKNLERDIYDALPENYGYLLIALPIGIPSTPTFLSNMERSDSSNAMRAILEVFAQNN